jgi:hypothetical protein
MTAPGVARLDKSRPPPGYGIDRCGIVAHMGWPEDGHFTLASAWAHYETRHDSPGMTLEPYWATVSGSTRWDVQALGQCVARFYEEQKARAAAWAWYWRRVALADRVGRECSLVTETLFRGHNVGLPSTRVPVEVWPCTLTWSEEQVVEVERWLAEGGETPEVLRG